MAELTGKHVLGITVGAFSVIIAVNLVMAYMASSTFPGLEVKNSYVASQNFDVRRDAQKALGWTLAHSYERGEMKLVFAGPDGSPVDVEGLDVLIGRTTSSRDDVRPAFTLERGIYKATVDLPAGGWMIKVQAHSKDGVLFEQRDEFSVRG